ncbi:MAG: hypothetical protein J6U39_03850, partial [Clostridia bacterium]|nr:hypothetical protein [Clostridia bacterium]
MEDYRRKTPLMGWASWNCFRTNINEEKLKRQFDALVSTGLAACGYVYANTDDGFFGGRAADGILLYHKERFPNGIKPLADYAHSLGLKAIGENRVQELLAKYDDLDPDLEIHFIGALQTNKVKYIIDKVSLIHSLDREDLALEIEKQA